MMNKKGGLHLHRGLIALTGTFLAAVALSGCGNEKMAELRTGYEPLTVGQTEIALQKEAPLAAGGHPVSPAPRQTMNAEKIHPVQPAPVDKLTVPSKPPLSAETPAVLSPATASAPHSTQCWTTDIATPLREVVTSLEEKSLLYGIKPLTDCSGIFHRVLLGLEHRCPGRDFPSVKKYRDSRELARWYHERGKLKLIKNAMESTDLIKPGAVLFFGRNGSEYKNFSVEDLLTPHRGIAHLGVVVKVHKNESGEVLRYELFHGHGRKGKTAASITDWHRRTPTRVSYPPFGNGRQQLVAVARL